MTSSGRDLASPHHMTVTSVLTTELSIEVGGHRFRGGDDSGAFSVWLAVDTRETKRTLIKSSFKDLVVKHQLPQTFDFIPRGAGVRVLDDEVSFVL